MRVTPKITTSNFIRNIHQQAGDILKAQEQIATQKRINKISDDPIGMGRVLGYRSKIAAIEQYEENIDQGISQLEFNEITLDLASDLVLTAKRVAEDYSGLDHTANQKQLAADQIKDLYDHLVSLGNSKFNNNYIFSGHATDTAPFSRDANFNATYHGDDGQVRLMVGDNVEITFDADGRNIFQNAANGGVNLFDELKNLIDGLENPDAVAGSAQIKATVSPLYNARQQINNRRSEYAPALYRLQFTDDYWANLKPKVQGALANTEQTDIAKTVLELTNLEVAYETTLATAARIIQPSLMDFLR
ncbi:Flagellar hook-associated protein FlgL [Olavius sp. associated proteobacterium Delta 1]|nr:Flagellar hook-associated protein FlgL [Olavius sp. associated proteobacterium Delta 1]